MAKIIPDEDMDPYEKALNPLLTDEFLTTLALAVRTCGNSVDWVETKDFALWCFAIAGKEPLDLEPLENVNEDTENQYDDKECARRYAQAIIEKVQETKL